MSNDVKFVVGMCVIVLTMFGSATLVSYVMIELVGRVRTDIQDLRESMEALACGEFARKADESNRVVDPGQRQAVDRSPATTRCPSVAWPNGHRDDRTLSPNPPERAERVPAPTQFIHHSTPIPAPSAPFGILVVSLIRVGPSRRYTVF